jgi:hypothetical protein
MIGISGWARSYWLAEFRMSLKEGSYGLIMEIVARN